MSVGLKKLKSLTIEDVPELKYVVGNYQQEQHSSYINQNEELCFDLPALETLAITNAPKINGICTNNYKMVLSSPLDVQICDCGIKSFIDHNLTLYVSTDGVPLHAAHSLLVPSLKNVRRIKLVKCCNLISLSTLSIATSTVSLENLIIRECHKLKYITTYEGDTRVDKNYCSIFPRLENLEIEDCEDLEFLFMSTISGGVKKLKYLTIKRVPELKYVVGNYQQEQHSSNQNQNEELQFDLLHLETLIISNAPNLKGVCTKNYKMEMTSLQKIEIRNCQDKSSTDHNLVNWRTTEDSTTARDSPFHLAQTLLVQSLKTVREIELVECWHLISLSTLSIASSTMALENLTIYGCHKVKCITANDGVAQADKYCSIFPRLQNLKIEDCKELEFLFVSAISIGLGNLKSLTIEEVPELKYVVGNYQKEQHSFNQNQIDKLQFDLLALENLYIEDAPKMNSICAKNYKLLLSSPLNVQVRNCGIKSFTIQEAHASTKEAHPLFHAAQSLLIQSLKNIRKMELANCESLIAMSSFSIASTILLEDLTIAKCHRLKCIIADEGGAATHMSYNSIFPKLKELHVSDCDALEYLFPAYAFRSPLYLETLSIHTAPMLKYVFGRSQSEDILTHENQIIQSYIDFPDLNDLSIKDVPQLVSICPKNYYLRGLPLRSIALGGFPKFLMRPCNQFLVFWHTKQQETKAMEVQVQALEYLEVGDTKIEVIFDLTYVDIEKNGDRLEPLTSSLQGLIMGNLSELEHICVGPKHILCFNSLHNLSINSCKKLKVIFSASTVRSLPVLKELHISKCEKLIHIVGEDYETNVDDHLCHEPCFPNLEKVSVKHCDRLKYLFFVTISVTLPKLEELDIRKACELEHVLIRRGEMKEMVMKDVLPQLEWLTLEELPNLISACHGIDFQTLEGKWGVTIEDCPNFSFYETTAIRLQTGPESADFEAEEEAKEKLYSHQRTNQYSNIGDTTQHSLTKKVPIHKSPNPTVLPARDNTQASAKNFEDEDKEQETTTTPNGSKNQDSEIWEGTDQKLSYRSNGRRALETQQSTTSSPNFTRSGTKEDAMKIVEEDIISEKPKMIDLSSDSNVKGSGELFDKEVKKETNIMEPKSQEEVTRHDIQSHEEEKPEGDLIVSCTTPILSEQTSEAILTKSSLSSIASTGLDQTPQATLGKPVDDDDFQVSYKSHVDDKNIKETNVVEDESKANSSDHVSVDPSNLKQIEQELSSCSRGDQFVPVATISSEQTWEAILPLNPMSSEASTSFNQTPLSILTKLSDDSQPRRAMSTTSFVNISQHESSKEPFLGNLNSTVLPRGPSATVKRFEEGGFITTHRHGSDMNVASYLPVGEEYNTSNHGNPFVSPMPFISSEKQASEMILPASLMPSRALTSPQPILMSTPFKSTYGRNVQENVETTNQPLNQNFSQFALRVAEVQEIVDMMKLEGVEAYMLAEALNTYPQLLSLEYRSNELLRCSYRVLLNILNILTTRSPVTITEADKRLLLEHLNDASVLGFDKDWLDSIVKNVIDYDVSEAQYMQQVLQDLGNKLHNKKSELANAYKGLGEAQIEFNFAQQKHANAREHHSQLLQECQEILEQRDQCWETIAAQFRPFGI